MAGCRRSLWSPRCAHGGFVITRRDDHKGRPYMVAVIAFHDGPNSRMRKGPIEAMIVEARLFVVAAVGVFVGLSARPSAFDHLVDEFGLFIGELAVAHGKARR